MGEIITVYVAIIEAIKSLVPVTAREIGQNLFVIETNPYFDPEDNSSVSQFIPGDTVVVEPQSRHDFNDKAKKIILARELVGSTNSNRDAHMLRYIIVDQDGILSQEQLAHFQTELERLKKAIAGQRYDQSNPFHPAILRWFDGTRSR